MKNKIIKAIVVGVAGIAIGASVVTLPACSNEKTEKKPSGSSQTYKLAKENGYKTYKLAFFENRASSDTKNVYYTLGYYKKGKLVTKCLNSEDDDYKEVIAKDAETPYVVINDDTYYIHRPPYSEYNQPLIKGKVTAKEND